MKKWILIQVAAIVVVAVIGVIWKANLPDDGLSTLHTQEDALGKGFGVEYVMGTDLSNSLVNYPEQFDDIVDVSDVIVIGRPTGKIFQQGEIFCQEVLVNEIIKGEERLRADGLEKSLYMINADGFRRYDDGKVRYMGGYGLMQESSDYLLFLGYTDPFQLLPVNGYEMLGGFFGRIKLDDNAAGSTPMSTPAEELSYDEIWDYEYIANSQEVLDEVYRMKEHILSLVDYRVMSAG
jgi:hypothetical protein